MQKKSSNKLGECAHCNNTGSQIVCYSKRNIEHRRCSECGEVSVFGYVTDAESKSTRGKEWKLLDFDQIMNYRITDSFPRYLIQNDYHDGDYLDHPQFGNGYVLRVVSPRKMKVLFDGQLKLLMCGAGSPRGINPAATSSRKRKK